MYLFSKSILLPLAKLNDRIKNSTVSTLSDKLSVPNSDDEIAELTVSFNKMTDRIQEAFLFQQQFSGNVAHELKTPLTIMKTKIDVFEKRENHTSAEYKELIENQKNQLMRLSEIIQTLLEITNTDNVQEKEHFLVSDMIENILLDFSNMTAQKNICIATDLQNVEIYGNVDLLYRAFSNLIQNSIRYNVKNGDIYISAKQKQHDTVIQICDTGIGISEENRQRIFEPFFRVDKSRSREMGGAGLGLSIVKKIIEKHDGIFDVYGDSVLDISLYNSFTGAVGTGDEENDNPNVDVDQNVNGIYEKYQNDDRIEFITYVEPFDNITIDDSGKNYSVQSSGNVPVINKIIAGRMGTGSSNEIVIPESLVKNMGITAKEALGKEVTFHGEITEWQGDTPSFKPVSVKAEIVGVIDSTMVTNYEGERAEYSIDDSFFFSKSALKELLAQSTKDTQNLNVLMRVKTPEDLIAIKDELNKAGLVPTGYFELIEDLVRLNSQSSEQSSSANSLIIALVLVMVSTISLITSMLRKKEYAIFKISGFSNENLRILNLFESFGQCLLLSLF